MDTNYTISRPNCDWFIGYCGRTVYPYFLNGMVDDIRIYNRALAETEIQQLYTE